MYCLQALAKNAKRRIVLTSLYLGTGPLEQELVSTLLHVTMFCCDVRSACVCLIQMSVLLSDSLSVLD
jgi:hypothetical protein